MSLIKICGLSRPEDIEYANNCEPDFIGFVFAKSRRQVTADKAMLLKERLRTGIKAAGVFVNADPAQIRSLCEAGVIDIVQLHGDEDEAYIGKLKADLTNPIIKAIAVRGNSRSSVGQIESLGNSRSSAGQIESFGDSRNSVGQIESLGDSWSSTEKIESLADYLLFDAAGESARGGSGKSFDWSLIGNISKPFFLAGGLNSGNIERAIRTLRPYAVDLSSGVETDGFKDPEKMLHIVKQVRETTADLQLPAAQLPAAQLPT